MSEHVEKYKTRHKKLSLSEDSSKVWDRLFGEVRKLRQLIQRKTGRWIPVAKRVTTAGGAAMESISVVGVKSSSVVIVGLDTAGAVPRVIKSCKTVKDAIEVTFDGDPAADHVVSYIVCY